MSKTTRGTLNRAHTSAKAHQSPLITTPSKTPSVTGITRSSPSRNSPDGFQVERQP